MPFWRKAAKAQIPQRHNVPVGLTAPKAPSGKEANPQAKYCLLCNDLDFQRLFYSAERENIDLPKRLLTDLRAFESCPFCRITLLAIQHHPAVQNQDEECGVMGQSQRSDNSDIPITYNRAIVFWVFKITAGTTMILPSEPHSFGIRPLALKSRESLPRNRELLRSDTPPPSDILCGQIVESYFDPALPRWWLQRCKEEHRKPCAASPPSFDFGLKFIDVELGCIVKAPSNCEYAALSYVWGNVKQLQLCKDTRTRLTVPGSIRNKKKTQEVISEHRPSLTISDAIFLCTQLKYRYLWVDALCIQQDSEDRMVQIQNMGRIYSGASLTIVAASGSDANAGLHGLSGGMSRNPCQYRETLGHVPVVSNISNYEDSMDAAPWKTRGWTFQEEMLSHRCLIITGHQLFFRCSEATWCEDTFTEPTALIPDPSSSFALVHHNETSRGNIVLNEAFPGQHGLDMRINFYNEYIKEYTSRDLRVPEDRLDAISGVLQTLSLQTNNFMQFTFGIPFATFNYSLCWASKYHRPDRRVFKYPSWSWAGWLAPIKYEIPYETWYLNAEGFAHVDPSHGHPFNATSFTVTGNSLSFATYATKLRVSREKSMSDLVDEISFKPPPQDPSNAVYDVYSPRNELIGRIILSSAWREAQADELFFITIGPDTQRSRSGEITRQHGVMVLCIQILNGLCYRVQLLRPVVVGPRVLGSPAHGGTPIYRFDRKQWNAWTNPQRANVSMG